MTRLDAIAAVARARRARRIGLTHSHAMVEAEDLVDALAALGLLDLESPPPAHAARPGPNGAM